MRKTISLVLAVLMMLVLLPAVKLSPAVAEDDAPTYEKVESADAITDGSYLIVVDSKKIDGAYYAFNGTDANSYNKVDVDIADGVITGNYAANEIQIAAVEGGFTLKNSDGKYLGAPSANSIDFSETALVNGIAMGDDLTVSINMSTDAARELKLNNTNDQPFFRYYKVSTSNANYYLPSLYKKVVTTEPDPEPDPEPEPEPETTAMELVTELKNGDEVVIFNAANNKIMTGAEYYYENTSNPSKSKWEIVAADATLTDDVLSVPEEAVVLTVEILVPDTEDPEMSSTDEEPNVYAFKTADGKYLYADNKDTRFVERDQENAENTFFQLEPVEGGFYIKCNSATYNDKAQYIEYYKNYFTVYSMGTDASIYTFQFYAEPGETPEPPVVEPAGDTVILFTNDVHCGIRDGWGYAGVADLKKTLEAAGNEVLLVDAGDHVQGGSIGSLTRGEAIIEIMNFVGYDLATLGNHEFDYGMDRMFELVEMADYPYVSANFMDLTTNAPVLDAYKIIEANGKKIAFVGLSTPESITKSTPAYFMNAEHTEYLYGFCQDDTGAGVYTAAQTAIDAAKAEGADYVILVGHMGIDEQSKPWTAPEVIANVTGVDAFIDGHSHSVINTVVQDKEGKPVLHGQTGTKLANVGKLTIDAEGEFTLELLPAEDKVQDDPETDAFIKTIEDEFNALLNSVVAHTDHILTIKDPETGARAVRRAETNLGDLCADAYQYMFDSDIAFVNGGGVRADIAVGDITFQQIINVHPFGNTAVLAEVSGQTILDALEMGARVCPSENGGFLQVAGLTYEIHTYVEANVELDDAKVWQGPKDPNGEYRVKNVQVFNKETNAYEPLDLEKKYTLASHNYMLMDMGDGMAMFNAESTTILSNSGIPDNQVLIDYIQSMPEVNEVHQVEGYTNPKGEGRITINEGSLFYGEDVKSPDVMEETEDGELFRYDVKVKNIDPELAVVGLQTFVQYDNTALTFVEAKSNLDGSTGINEKDGVISFAWASNGDGITITDESVVVSLYFKLAKAVPNGAKLDFVFVPAENGATTGYSYVENDSVIEAEHVQTKDGSITFELPDSLTIYGEDVNSLDIMTVENGERLYKYDIRVKDLPAAGLKVNSVQVFLNYDNELLELVDVESTLEGFVYSAKKGDVFFVWATDSDVRLNDEDVILTLCFSAPNAKGGEVATIGFTVNALNTGSAMSFAYCGQVLEIEATTVDGSITFATAVLGDANCDGQITAADAALILRSIVGLSELSAQGAFNADVDGDGEVTAEDAAIILRYIVKLIDKFPVEETEEP